MKSVAFEIFVTHDSVRSAPVVAHVAGVLRGAHLGGGIWEGELNIYWFGG